MNRSQNSALAAESVSPKHTAAFVSVKTLATNWDCSRTTVSRLLDEAGIQAYYLGGGRNGSKRYLKTDVDQFLQSVAREEQIGSLRRTADTVRSGRQG
jgi:hypothetical protein